MKHLPDPIKETLQAPVDERFVRDVWSHVDRPASSTRSSRFAWSVAAVASIALGFVLLRGSETPAPPKSPAPLLAQTALRVGETTLHDGSSITLTPGAVLHPLIDDGDEMALLLDRGRVSFQVRPGRRWSVDTGLARVEVVGTRFTVDRSSDSVRVDVEAGVVVVRSQYLAARVVRLVAGQTVTVRPPPTPVSPPAPTTDAGVTRSPTPSRIEEAPQPQIALVEEPPNLNQRLARADRLRIDGRTDEAEALLSDIVEHHAEDARAALAAFTLGRIAIDRDDHHGAAMAFETAIDLGLPAAIEEDAYRRRFESYAAAGEFTAASKAARDYLVRYENGRHQRAAKRFVDR